MTLPNFLVIGAMKAGTTTIYDYLRQHPAVFMSHPIKEPKFFCIDGAEKEFYIPVKTMANYLALFEAVRDERAIGEASANYLAFAPAAQKIRETIPEAKLIASLRNPVDRAYSLYQMNLRNRNHNRDLPFIQALKRDPWLMEGYFENLQRFHTLFDPSQIKVILFDELIARPLETMRPLFAFLDVDPDFTPEVLGVSNPGGLPRLKVLHTVLASERAKRFGRKYLPDSWVESVKRIRNKNLKKQEISAQERTQAEAHFREDILRTQDLIGKDLGHWLSMDAADGLSPTRRAGAG